MITNSVVEFNLLVFILFNYVFYILFYYIYKLENRDKTLKLKLNCFCN